MEHPNKSKVMIAIHLMMDIIKDLEMNTKDLDSFYNIIYEAKNSNKKKMKEE